MVKTYILGFDEKKKCPNKSDTVLILFDLLMEGRKINKDNFCFERGICTRSFNRYIYDIREFLKTAHPNYELLYNAMDKEYYLKGIERSLMGQTKGYFDTFYKG